jgi:hypothetical protein
MKNDGRRKKKNGKNSKRKKVPGKAAGKSYAA